LTTGMALEDLESSHTVYSSFRIVTLLALLLPALVLPRGLVLSMCWCGYGLDASLCAAGLTSELSLGSGEITCSCADADKTCRAHDDRSRDGRRRESIDHDATCPLCHTVSVDGPTIDYTLSAAPDVVAPMPVLACHIDSEVRRPPIARTICEQGRAPPNGMHADTGLWPGVRPMRI
jgi:hypothetical protein